MDYKLDYMVRLFRTIRNKKYEAYVIQRIWDLLDDERILFVTQQYFKRQDNDSYALADLYLPQIKLIVEVDESQHETDEHKIADEERTKQINLIEIDGSSVNIEIKRVKIYKNNKESYSLSEVNAQIADIVNYIRAKIKGEGSAFKPWDGDNLMTPDYYKKKGYFKVSENDYIKSIDDAAEIFGTKAKHRGYLRAAGFDVPGKDNTIVWCPATRKKEWENELKGQTIYECNNNSQKRKIHVKEQCQKDETRITFLRYKDDLGFNFYKFVGVFRINKKQSLKEKKCVWERIMDKYEL